MLFKLHASSASDLKGPHNHCDGSLLEHSHQFILNFFFLGLFQYKNLLFPFYNTTFTKYPHQIIYFTFFFTIPLLQNTHIKLSIFLKKYFISILSTHINSFSNILSHLSLLILILFLIFYLCVCVVNGIKVPLHFFLSS